MRINHIPLEVKHTEDPVPNPLRPSTLPPSTNAPWRTSTKNQGLVVIDALINRMDRLKEKMTEVWLG